MKVIHLAYSNFIGGASVAANRIHLSLLKHNIDSEIWANELDENSSNFEKNNNKLKKIIKRISIFLVWPLKKLIKTDISIHHSIAIIPSDWCEKINNSDADIVNLHWIQRETLSIKDISKIKKPIVWTLHDMWAFCGAEHYTNDDRWRKGYKPNNRPNYESGFDINRWNWKRKKKYWKKEIQIVTPSTWLADCVKESELMKNWPVSVIANPIDTERWSPMDKKKALEHLNLPTDVPLILFGAIGGSKDLRKGYDHLLSALNYLKNIPNTKKFELVVFGENKPKLSLDLKFPSHFLGHLGNDISLRAAYSAVDVVVVPSKQDNLPNIAVEAQACGVPVVAFDIGGLPDIIDHKKTGYLAEAFDIKDLANGIYWVLDHDKPQSLRNYIHAQAVLKFNESTIAKKYLSIYSNIKKIKPAVANQVIQISFIMPAYNSDKFISESIQELQKENVINWELIIIDDFSTDKTFELAQSFADKDSRIKVFKNIKKGKVIGTNYGYSLCSGNIIKCIDSDDILDQDYFKHYNQLKNYQAHCHNAIITDSELNNIIKYSINPKMLSKNYRYVLSNLLTFPKWAWSFDRSIASKIFPMPENLPFEDVWINLIIKKNSNKIYHINEPIYKYRQHNNQTFGGILNFDKAKVIFRANRIKKLLQIIINEDRIMDGIEKNFLKNMEIYYEVTSREKISYYDIFKLDQSFIQKLKIILMRKLPKLNTSVLYLKWKLNELF